MNPTLIYLIGYMGSGKSTLGKALAKKLNYIFIDIDEEIEKKTGHSINQLFEKYGEDGFRNIEKKYLEDTIHLQNTIISTGGGAPCFFQNMEMMNKAGTTIYIKMSIGGLINRLQKGKNERPLIKDKSDKELREFISESLIKREFYYNKAHFTIKGENLKTETVIKLFS